MLTLMLLLACVNAPPPPDTDRWDPNAGYPVDIDGALMKRAVKALLHDPDPKVRRSAAGALSCCRNPEVVPSLLQALQDQDAEVRKRAIERFGNYPDDRAVEPLIRLLKDPDASVRDETLRFIICRHMDPRFVPPLLDVLQNSKETDRNRVQAAWGLQYTEDRRAVEPFRKLLVDRTAPPWVRSEVAEGLQHFHDVRAVEPLITLLSDVQEPLRVRIGVARALARFGDRRASDLLIQMARSDGPRDLRFWSAIGAVDLTQGTIDDLRCITPIIDSYSACDGVEDEVGTKSCALATIVEHAKDQTVRLVAARMLIGIAPGGLEDTAEERDTRAQLELGEQALRQRKLAEARSCFEKAEKLSAKIPRREGRIALQSQVISAMAAIAETALRWSKMTPAEIAAEQEGVDALRDKAMVYFRGDPYVRHHARPYTWPSVPIGADSLVEGLVVTPYDPDAFCESDMRYLEKMPSLRMLYLDRSKVSPQSLAHIKGLEKLEYLGLPTSVTDAELPKLLDRWQLIALRLHGKGITDNGLKHVAHLRGLVRLSLDDTAITDAGLKDLAKLTRLRELSLGSTRISDAGLEQLAAMPLLEEVRLHHTQVTPQGVQKLKKALPNCTVVDEWPMYAGRHQF
jgi:hypothetical protein